MDHTDMDHGLTIVGEVLVVLGQPAVTAEPGKGSFDNPTPGQQNKPLDSHRTKNRLQQPTAGVFDPFDQLPSVCSVSPNDLQARELVLDPFQQTFGSVAILNVRRMNEHSQQQSQCVDQQVAFAARDFFSPRRSPVRRLDPWSSPTGCPGSPHWALRHGLPVAARSVASSHGRAPTYRPSANAGNSRKPIPKAENHAAACARHTRYKGHTELRSPVPHYRVCVAARPAWAAGTNVRCCPTGDP